MRPMNCARRSALQIQIDNLRHSDRDGLFADRLAEVEAGIGRATNLVSKLLRLARYDAREPPLALEPIDLVKLAVDTVARLTPLAESRSIDLGVTSRHPSKAIGALADFEIILGNLVENALRYTPQGGTVDVAVQVTGKEARIEVRDTGPGIQEEEMARVFERFFRARPQDAGKRLRTGDRKGCGRKKQSAALACSAGGQTWPYCMPHRVLGLR